MDVEVAKNWRCDGDVRYGTSVRVGTYQLATPGMELSARTGKRLCSFNPMDGALLPPRARVCLRQRQDLRTSQMDGLLSQEAGERSAGFSRDSRKSFDGAGQGWCNGNGN